MDGENNEKPYFIKWMIWWYPYFWKHPGVERGCKTKTCQFGQFRGSINSIQQSPRTGMREGLVHCKRGIFVVLS